MTRARKTLSAIFAAVMLLVLSGCVVFEMDMEVDSELNVSGSALVGIVVSDLEGTGMTAEDLLGDVQSDMGIDDLPPGASMETVDDGEIYGYRVTYDGVGQNDVEFNDGDAALFTLDGDKILFNMENPFFDADMDLELDDDNPFGDMFGGMSMLTRGHISMTFPGDVTDAPGAEISGNKATWDLTTFSGEFLTAEANSSGGVLSGGSSILTIALIAVAILALIAIIVGVVMMRKKKKPGSAPVAASAPQGYAPQDPQYGQPQAPGYGQPQAPGYGQPQAPDYGQAQSPGQPQAPDQGQAQQYGQPQNPGYGQQQQPYSPPQPPNHGQNPQQ